MDFNVQSVFGYISIILRKSKLIKLKNSLLFLSFLTLFLFSNPLISNKLVKYIEAPYLLDVDPFGALVPKDFQEYSY